MPLGYEISPKSSIFADTRAAATSGGAFALGGNPNLDALFGNGGGSSVQSWVIPAAAIVAALSIGAFLTHRFKK